MGGLLKPTFFESAADFRRWLDAHHATAPELLIGFYKRAAGRGLTYPEALDEALSFGWIDGIRKRVDADRYTIRFTARRSGSIWSTVNIRRVSVLIEQRRMKPSGLRAFQERDERKTRQYSYERQVATLDPKLAATLRSNAKASAFFNAQPPGYQRIVTHWVMSAKKEETRARRLTVLIDHSARAARIDFMKPTRSGS